MTAAPGWKTTAATNGSGTTINATVPSGVSVGDVVMAIIYTAGLGAATSVTPPDPSWKQKGATAFNTAGGIQTSLFWKRATGADTGSYTFTLGAAPPTASVADVMRYSGAAAAGDPIDGFVTAATSGKVSTTPAVSLSTTGANRLLVWAAFGQTTNASLITPPAQMTTTEWSGSRSRVVDWVQAAAGGTGSITGTTSLSGGDHFNAILVALSPDVAGPPPSGGFFDFF